MAALELSRRRGPRPSRSPLPTPAPQGRPAHPAVGDSAATLRAKPPASASPASVRKARVTGGGRCRSHWHIWMTARTDQLRDLRRVLEFPVPQFPHLRRRNELILRAPGARPGSEEACPTLTWCEHGAGPGAPAGQAGGTSPRTGLGPPVQIPRFPWARPPPAGLSAPGTSIPPGSRHHIRGLEAVNFLITAPLLQREDIDSRRNNGTNKIKIKKLIILCVCNLIKAAVKFYCFSR